MNTVLKQMINSKSKDNKLYLNDYDKHLLGDEEIKYLLANDTNQIIQLALGKYVYYWDRNNITAIGINYMKSASWNKLNSLSLS